MNNKELIEVSIPSFAKQEMEYIISIFFDTILGLTYQINYSDKISDCIIRYDQKEFIIKNVFWKNGINSYFLENIPENISEQCINIDHISHTLVCIYGHNNFEIIENKFILSNDIIAASFFMLTRWEEKINSVKDRHNRFLAKESFAYKNNFIEKPIVNEYGDFLFSVLRLMGYQGFRKKSDFSILPTHDIDFAYYYKNKFTAFKKLIYHFIKRKSTLILSDINFIKTKNDPYDSYNLLMDDAEKLNTKAHFFFMNGGKSYHDNNYQIHEAKLKVILNNIKNRGHRIGIHPSYNSYNDLSQFQMELDDLQNKIDYKISFGRQHFLRFDVSETWNVWEKSHMEWDSTMGYSDVIGFRCGICQSFPVFDFNKRERLKLMEKPLMLMDVTLKDYSTLSPVEAIVKVESLMNTVKKHHGEFVYLWHNSSFTLDNWEAYKPVYDSIIQFSNNNI